MTTTPEATITRDRAGRPAARWFDICSYADLIPERGVCAMVDGTQVAVFRAFDGALQDDQTITVNVTDVAEAPVDTQGPTSVGFVLAAGGWLVFSFWILGGWRSAER